MHTHTHTHTATASSSVGRWLSVPHFLVLEQNTANPINLWTDRNAIMSSPHSVRSPKSAFEKCHAINVPQSSMRTYRQRPFRLENNEKMMAHQNVDNGLWCPTAITGVPAPAVVCPHSSPPPPSRPPSHCSLSTLFLVWNGVSSARLSCWWWWQVKILVMVRVLLSVVHDLIVLVRNLWLGWPGAVTSCIKIENASSDGAVSTHNIETNFDSNKRWGALNTGPTDYRSVSSVLVVPLNDHLQQHHLWLSHLFLLCLEWQMR